MAYKNRQELLEEVKKQREILSRVAALIDGHQLFADTPSADVELLKIRELITNLNF